MTAALLSSPAESPEVIIADLLEAEAEAGPLPDVACACVYRAVVWQFEASRRHSFSPSTAARGADLLMRGRAAAGRIPGAPCPACVGGCPAAAEADALLAVAALSVAAKRDEAGLPNNLAGIQLKTPWACRPFAAAAVTAGELALLAHLDWRTSSPTPCDFAGALVRLALPGPDAAPARAVAGQVSDAAIEAASTGRAGAATAAARPSAIGAAAALIGLHGAGRGEAAAVFLGMMDEVAVAVLEALRAAIAPAAGPRSTTAHVAAPTRAASPPWPVATAARPAPAAPVAIPTASKPAPVALLPPTAAAAVAAAAAGQAAAAATLDDDCERESTPTSILEADWKALALRSSSGGHRGAGSAAAAAFFKGGVTKKATGPASATRRASAAAAATAAAQARSYAALFAPQPSTDGGGGSQTSSGYESSSSTGSGASDAATVGAAGLLPPAAAAALGAAVPHSGAWAWA